MIKSSDLFFSQPTRIIVSDADSSMDLTLPCHDNQDRQELNVNMEDVDVDRIMDVVNQMILAEKQDRTFDPEYYLQTQQGVSFQDFTKSQQFTCNYIILEDNNNNNNYCSSLNTPAANFDILKDFAPVPEFTNEENDNLVDIVTDMTQTCSLNHNNHHNDTFKLEEELKSVKLFKIHRIKQYMNLLNPDALSLDQVSMVCKDLSNELISILSDEIRKPGDLWGKEVQAVIVQEGKLLSQLFDKSRCFSATNANKLLEIIANCLKHKYDSVLQQMDSLIYLSDFTENVENPEMLQCLYESTIMVIKDLLKNLKKCVDEDRGCVKYNELTSIYNSFSFIDQLVARSTQSKNWIEVHHITQLKCIEKYTHTLPFSSISFLATKSLCNASEKFQHNEVPMEP